MLGFLEAAPADPPTRVGPVFVASGSLVTVLVNHEDSTYWESTASPPLGPDELGAEIVNDREVDVLGSVCD